MREYQISILIITMFQFFIFFGVNCQEMQIDDHEQLINRLHNFRDLPDELVIASLDSADLFIQKGDTLILSTLFELTFESDGYVSELLGTILGELFLQKTEFFLNYLQKWPKEQQSHIVAMAFYMDGGGMSSDNFEKIEIKLKNLKQSKDRNLSELVNICLTTLQEVRNEVEN